MRSKGTSNPSQRQDSVASWPTPGLCPRFSSSVRGTAVHLVPSGRHPPHSQFPTSFVHQALLGDLLNNSQGHSCHLFLSISRTNHIPRPATIISSFPSNSIPLPYGQRGSGSGTSQPSGPGLPIVARMVKTQDCILSCLHGGPCRLLSLCAPVPLTSASCPNTVTPSSRGPANT